MKTEFFLLKKYWLSHKKQALSILVSIIIMSSVVMFISLLTRSEESYSFHEVLDMCGNFDGGLYNATESEIDLIKEQDEIDQTGKTIVFGRIGNYIKRGGRKTGVFWKFQTYNNICCYMSYNISNIDLYDYIHISTKTP